MIDSALPVVKLKPAPSTGGTEFNAAISKLTVSYDLETPPMFEIEVTEPSSTPGVFTWADDTNLEPGTDVAISVRGDWTLPGGGAKGSGSGLGRLASVVSGGGGGKTQELIEGEITAIDARFDIDGPPAMTIRGFHLAHRMTRGDHTRAFEEKDYVAIIKKVVSESKVGFKNSFVSKPAAPDRVVQRVESDWAFVRRLVGLIDAECFVDDGVVHLRPRPKSRRAAHTLRFGDEIVSFAPQLNAAKIVGEVMATGWDSETQKPIVGRARSQSAPVGSGDDATKVAKRFRTASVDLVDVAAADTKQASEMAAAELERRVMSYGTAKAMLHGNPDIKVGTTIEVSEVGKKFGGHWYVSGVTHSVVVGGSGFRTQLSLKRSRGG